MDRRERYNNMVVAVRAMLHQERADMWTALPAIVQSYDPTKVSVSVQPSIMGQFRQQNGPNADEAWVDVKLPVLVDCPVFFPGGGGYLLSFPLAKGDEGGVIFSARCIDAWWQSGGVQRQAELRMHDLSDGMFIPGLFSLPRVPVNLSNTDVQLRNMAGDCSVSINPAKQIVIVAPGGVAIQGALTVTGDITGGLGSADQVGLRTHTHSGVSTGGAQTTAPVAGT
jgi:hypothetical protein